MEAENWFCNLVDHSNNSFENFPLERSKNDAQILDRKGDKAGAVPNQTLAHAPECRDRHDRTMSLDMPEG